MQDERLKFVNEVLDREPGDEAEREIQKNYTRKNGRIFRKTEEGLRWAVPRPMRRDIVRMCHDEMGHVALSKTLDKMKRAYWFPPMRNYAKNYIACCISCFYSKKAGGKKPGELHPIEKVPEPMHTLHVDHFRPFVKSTLGNSYLIVIIDAFTKFVFLKAVANTKALLVERFFNSIAETFG